jgi:acyl dehydratase
MLPLIAIRQSSCLVGRNPTKTTRLSLFFLGHRRRETADYTDASVTADAAFRRCCCCYHNHLRKLSPLLGGSSTASTSMMTKQRLLHYHVEQKRFVHDFVIRGTMMRKTTTATTLRYKKDAVTDETCYYKRQQQQQQGLAWNDLRVGHYAELERVYTRHDVETFSSLIGDYNPLHREWRHPADDVASSCAAETNAATMTLTRPAMMILPQEFLHHPLVHWNDDYNSDDGNKTSKILVHGMLVASVFSGILGTVFPGCVYRGQALQFRNPVYCRDCVVGRVTITAIKPTRVPSKSRRRQHPPQQQDETTENEMPEEEERGGLILMCDTQVLSPANGKKNGQQYRGSDNDADDDENEKQVVEYIRGKATVWLVP